MTPVRTGRTLQVTVRLEHDVADRLDVLAQKLSRPGLELSRSDAIKIAILAGLPGLEEAEGIKAKQRKS